jgi:hypothetical protein
MLIILVFLVSAFFLFRTTLILAGLLKGPILKSFEKYGDEENLYFPAVHFVWWLPVFLASFGLWLFDSKIPAALRSPYIPYCAVMIGAYLMYASYRPLMNFAERHGDWFAAYPRWYNELRERTTRAERRRIAYMWLYLPWRARLLYNSNNVAFLVWLDLVLLATVRPETDVEPVPYFNPRG